MKKVKENCFGILCVLGAAMIAILVHALLPSPGATLAVDQFDGILVRIFGFPAVASVYFVVLYLHILIVIRYFGAKSVLPKKEIGIRLGLAFGGMYLVGMQEVVVSASPCDTYGFDFISYQFFMGLGDAIPVMFLCILVSHLMRKNTDDKKTNRNNKPQQNTIFFTIIAILFFVERVIGYYVGYIESDIQRYPISVLLWTLVFGMLMGGIYVLLRPIYTDIGGKTKNIQLLVLTVGINWIWFNCFMGLILKGMFIKMFIRGGLDILVITIGCVVTTYIIKIK